MSWWPFAKREGRSADYTGRIIEAAVDAATTGAGADASATAALEAACGIWSRSFGSASVTGASASVTDAITPDMLAMVGRDLIRRGESVWVIEVVGGRLMLYPAGTVNVHGGTYREADWTYRVSLYGPGATESRNVPSAGVLHFRYAHSSARPWIGVAPLDWAALTGRLLANSERSLEGESRIPSNVLLPVHVDEIRSQQPGAPANGGLSESGGGIFAVRHMGQQWDAKPNAGASGWHPIHVHSDPTQGAVSLRTDAATAVFTACGVPANLGAVPNSDGTALRESWRRFLHGSVAPIAGMVAWELAAKLDAPGLMLDFERLFASDLTGRARAFGSVVSALAVAKEKGIDTADAAAMAGILMRVENGDVP